MLEYTKAYEKANPTRPEGTPLLHLGYKDRKGEEITLSFGVNKLRDIVANMETFKNDINSANLDDGFFVKDYTFGTKFPWTLKMTVKKYEIINHYMDDIQNYIAKYYVPWTPRPTNEVPHKCSEVPYVSVYEDDRCNVKHKLFIPCWDKQPVDEGEGMRCWGITEFMANYLVKDGESGKCYNNIKNWLKDAPDDASYEYPNQWDIKFSKKQCEAFIKYYDTVLKFVVNPESI